MCRLTTYYYDRSETGSGSLGMELINHLCQQGSYYQIHGLRFGYVFVREIVK